MNDTTTKACSICGAEVTAKDPERYPFCRNCHYTGAAAERLRAAQVARFESAFPEASVAIEHTGGGCFWLAIRWEGEGNYVILTDGNASLPTTEEGEDIANGGWGYVGLQNDDEESAHFEGTPLAEADPYEGEGMTDEAAIEVVRRLRTLTTEGTRVRLRHDVDRYPHFIARAGMLGTVVGNEDGLVRVRLDDALEGAEEWENEVHWYVPNGDDPARDVEAV